MPFQPGCVPVPVVPVAAVGELSANLPQAVERAKGERLKGNCETTKEQLILKTNLREMASDLLARGQFGQREIVGETFVRWSFHSLPCNLTPAGEM